MQSVYSQTFLIALVRLKKFHKSLGNFLTNLEKACALIAIACLQKRVVKKSSYGFRKFPESFTETKKHCILQSKMYVCVD